ncbi:phosphotransferase family protein [Algoriphagus sp.]|uniref:phosphotransferase family protein n=1 Tax=Algoriphagus sp. TaxID=1872435 RepID=UPI0027240A45|nr:phosphotransferase family protein [Algoriphagus sp.]MDO8968151.1 phosphotransferase family protein [Algoriphagus sp.]MDP3202252.1 phosphotransferase family protein [Algoriphagus sp.]
MDKSLDFSGLKTYLRETLSLDSNAMEITQISGGFSNLTFLIQTPKGKFAMRRAPFGDKISKAHDMVRECHVLEALQKAGYQKAPKPLALYRGANFDQAPLLVMEFVEGVILRNKPNPDFTLNEIEFRRLSENTIDSLVELHLLELKESGLSDLGKPEGYVERQVLGWSDRFFKAKTNELPEMEKVAQWLKLHTPQTENIGFLHNDYKYDNLVLDFEQKTEIKAVLDWEMATVGDPLMDLGTSLAYWAQADDPNILKMFNMTHLSGNMTRAEVIAYYGSRTSFDLTDILFYYVFGLFKVGVIAQQIYKRYTQGFANDPRFAGLIHVVEAAGKMAEKSILTEKI